jgi:hypothetical protein
MYKVVIETGRVKWPEKDRTGHEGNTDRYTVVQELKRKRTGQDGNTDRYTVVTGTGREK